MVDPVQLSSLFLLTTSKLAAAVTQVPPPAPVTQAPPPADAPTEVATAC